MSRYNDDNEKHLGGAYNGSDPEKVYGNDDHSNQMVGSAGHYEQEEEETHRSLKPRQISMIAIGGAIGKSSPPKKMRLSR